MFLFMLVQNTKENVQFTQSKHPGYEEKQHLPITAITVYTVTRNVSILSFICQGG